MTIGIASVSAVMADQKLNKCITNSKLKFSISNILGEQLDGRERAGGKLAPQCIIWSPVQQQQQQRQQQQQQRQQQHSLTPWSTELQRRFWTERFSGEWRRNAAGRRAGHPYQSRAPPKHKKPRTSFSRKQVHDLEARFNDQKYLASTERASLAQGLNMSDSQVKTWFQNRRTKWRRQTAEEKDLNRKTSRNYTSGFDIDEDIEHPSYFARPDITL